MFSFKNLFKRKPKKVYHCAQCLGEIDDNDFVFVFGCGKFMKVTHNTLRCVWTYMKVNNLRGRNLSSVKLKKIKSCLP